MNDQRLAMPENHHQMTRRILMLARGELALAQHQPDLALRQCELLLETAPQRVGETEAHVIPLLWKCQAEALFALGRAKEAIGVLEKARRGAQLQHYVPLLWQIERSLGRIYRQQRRQEEARQAFTPARHGIAWLSKSIEDPVLRSHFGQAAYSGLHKN